MTREELERVAEMQKGYEERIENQKQSINRLLANMNEAVARYKESQEELERSNALLQEARGYLSAHQAAEEVFTNRIDELERDARDYNQVIEDLKRKLDKATRHLALQSHNAPTCPVCNEEDDS